MRRKFLILFSLTLAITSIAQINTEAVDNFIERFSRLNEWSQEKTRSILSKAEYQPSIIEKMNRPAEGMPWYRYRRIFMTDERIAAGVDFYNEYKVTIDRVSEATGVSRGAIMGILGVETYYGQRKGSYQVLDALYTLAFGYPKRARFFTRELEEFLLLVEEEKLEIDEMMGSYAGAIGYCQFMPSSYRAYAKSFEDGGNRDLVNSPEDAIASIANYLKVHRWKKSEGVTSAIIASPDAVSPGSSKMKPQKTLAYYEEKGFMPVED
ncbi:MAG: lytic murein transglycosylase, partial [Bacteroidota bacterium]